MMDHKVVEALEAMAWYFDNMGYDKCPEGLENLNDSAVRMGLGKMVMGILWKVGHSEDYVGFGVAAGKLEQQTQYCCEYILGEYGRQNCGHGLRFIGNTDDYHFLKIHKDDVDTFVARVKKARGE